MRSTSVKRGEFEELRRHRVTRIVAFALGIWGVLGLLGLLIPGVRDWVVILPAIPLYFLSSGSGGTVTHGLLWDSAHGPPFLNTAGIVLVYGVPIFLAIALLLLTSKNTWSRKWPRIFAFSL